MSAKDVVIRGAGVLVVAGVLIGGGAYVVGDDPADYFVATTGSDSNPGTSGSPFLTLDKCYDTMTAGQTCEVATGVYDNAGISGSTPSMVYIREADGATAEFGNTVHLGTTATYTVGTDGYTLDIQGGESTTGFASSSADCVANTGTAAPCYDLNIGGAFFSCGSKTGTTFTSCKPVFSGGLVPLKFYDGADIRPFNANPISATNVELEGFEFYGLTFGTSSQNVTIRGGLTHQCFMGGSPAGITFTQGEIGERTTGVGCQIGYDGGTPTNIAFTYMTFRDLNCQDSGATPTDNCHMEGIHWGATNGLTFSNNTCIRVEQYCISLERLSGASDPDNGVIENNVFDCTWQEASPGSGAAPTRCGSFGAVAITPAAGSSATHTIRYNSFADGAVLVLDDSAGTVFSGTTLIGNVGDRTFNACNISGVTCSYNHWERSLNCPGTNETNTSCGAVLTDYFTDTANVDLTLKPAAPARAAGSPSSCPSLDRTGATRPVPDATTCDAGAYERD
jgi:hypothetical protein